MKTLFIDMGNSSTKWRLKFNDCFDQSEHGQFADLNNYLEEYGEKLKDLNSVYISSVSNESHSERLKRLFKTKFNIIPSFARVTKKAAGVTCGYTNVDDLGVDRWLAMIGATKKYGGNLLIVDAGTAITLDIINGNLIHLGGFILPGLRASSEILARNTSRIHDFYPDEQINIPGNDTQSCVIGGALFSVISVIKNLMSSYALRLVITGGDRQIIINKISEEYLVEENLVLDGLDCKGVQFY
tara:strand:+ start:599 stop:1324 length:726 start_codon:yes stop_codon:yes gene_type:complete